jgi:hypothetical protein
MDSTDGQWAPYSPVWWKLLTTESIPALCLPLNKGKIVFQKKKE